MLVPPAFLSGQSIRESIQVTVLFCHEDQQSNPLAENEYRQPEARNGFRSTHSTFTANRFLAESLPQISHGLCFRGALCRVGSQHIHSLPGMASGFCPAGPLLWPRGPDLSGWLFCVSELQTTGTRLCPVFQEDRLANFLGRHPVCFHRLLVDPRAESNP